VGEELDQVISETAQHFLVKTAELIAERTLDALVPGTGLVLTVGIRAVEAVRAIQVVTEGAGEIGVPIYPLGDIELMVDVRIGGSGAGEKLPVVGFLAPGGDDGLFGGFEIEPLEDDQKGRGPDTRDTVDVALRQDDGPVRAVIMDIDLSPIAQETTPRTRAAIMRDWVEQGIQPRLRNHKGIEDVELVVIYDQRLGIGAWLVICRKKNKWRIALRWDPERHVFCIEVLEVIAHEGR
jgi:hypothetical protein